MPKQQACHSLATAKWLSRNNPGRTTRRLHLSNRMRLNDPAKACPFRKLYPGIAMVQSAEERLGHDSAVTLDRPVFG
jgi:hypothetical protein